METVSLKLKPETSKRIARAVQDFDYGTKTEFIREAIRDKLSELERQKITATLLKLKGSWKGKTPFKTYEEWHNWRSNEGSKKLEKYFNEKFKLAQK